jgi:E3 ubiquitin-protein ligase RNF115/126
MQDRGRSGTPPASQEAIKNLPEVLINETHCKKDEKTGTLEYPRCTVCCEDLKDKATQMPCGHLFNKECIEEWLKQHNQCPVCRHELPTDDPDYEAQKRTRQE